MNTKNKLVTAVTVLTLTLGASLAAAVLSLYLGGVRQRGSAGSALIPIFTREAVGRQLTWVGPIFAVWLAAVIAAAVTGARPPQALPSAKRLPPMIRRKPGTAAAFALYVLRVALLTAAVILALLGIRSGGPRDVLAKAINICTECIGLG